MTWDALRDDNNYRHDLEFTAAFQCLSNLRTRRSAAWSVVIEILTRGDFSHFKVASQIICSAGAYGTARHNPIWFQENIDFLDGCPDDYLLRLIGVVSYG
jgi:hypothetical protein